MSDVKRWVEVPPPGGLGVLLLDDERPDVVPGFIVVFGVGPVAERELKAERSTLKEGEGGGAKMLSSTLVLCVL